MISDNVSDSDENLTTDAVPEGKTRDIDPETLRKPSLEPEQPRKVRENNEIPNLPGFKPKSQKMGSKNKSTNKASQKLVQYNITNASNVHIGSNYVVNVGKNTENTKPDKDTQDIPKTEAIERAMLNKTPINKKMMIFASTHIGKGWREMSTRMDLSDGQIDQFYATYIKINLKEVIYQILLDWTQANPDEATIGNLSTILWDCNEKDAVNRIVKEFCQKL